MSKTVMTVRGPIAAEGLGLTSMHEHILTDVAVIRSRVDAAALAGAAGPVQADDDLTFENRSFLRHLMILSRPNLRLDDEAVMTAEVNDFRLAGGSAIVETSAPGIRTTSADLLAFRRMSARTGVHIVACTGLYAEDSWPERFRSMGVEQFIEFMRGEIAGGIDDTGVRPGQIKVAYEQQTAAMDAFTLAAATVSRESGLSLQVHVGLLRPNEEIRATVLPTLYASACVPERTVICHVENWLGSLSTRDLVTDPRSVPRDLSLHKEVLDRGFNVCFTCFGSEWDLEPLGLSHRPDWFAMSGVLALIQQGYTGQILLGHDVFTKLCTRRGGGEGYTRIPRFVLPTLRDCGVSEADIRKLTVENPQRILAY